MQSSFEIKDLTFFYIIMQVLVEVTEKFAKL